MEDLSKMDGYNFVLTAPCQNDPNLKEVWSVKTSDWGRLLATLKEALYS